MLADAEDKVIFGCRLDEYKYYDMDQVTAASLDMCERESGDGGWSDRYAETDHEVTAEENAFDIEAEEIVECSEDIEE